MKKKYLLLLSLFLVGCTNPDNNDTNQSSSSEEISSTSEDTSMISGLIFEEYLDMDANLNLFVGQTYSLTDALKVRNTIEVKSSNTDVVEVKDGKLIAKSEGEITIYYILNGYYQDVRVKVSKEDLAATNFKFNYGNLEGKKIIAIGDSVTADATIGCPKTYPNLIKEGFNMSSVKNYAIGGTTATYMYDGSHIYDEYHSSTTAIDGCRVVKRAVEAKEVDDVDYAFIAFGHNDQYFQPPLDNADNPNNLLSLENCNSFKASYRYMIRMLRKANPNIRIILLNCTYSEYDKGNRPYGSTYSYDDYRNAIHEIATEFGCRYIDPWDYLKPYFKNQHDTYYKDPVHLSIAGQALLYEYIIKN